MVTIEPFRTDDTAFGLQLSQLAGWNQTPADWNRFVTLAPSGCFVARRDEQRVGTVMTCRFDNVAWIGMMLVDSNWRGQGIGRALMNGAIDYLDSQGVASVRLDATSLGEPLYTSMGFRKQFVVRRFAGNVRARDAHKDADQNADVQPVRSDEYADVLALDRQIVGYDRSRLLELLWNSEQGACLVSTDRHGVNGFLMRRPGRIASVIGPCIAKHPEGGQSLLSASLDAMVGQDVFVDVPFGQAAAESVVGRVGLQPVREFQRMTRGEPVLETVASLFASSGPELG